MNNSETHIDLFEAYLIGTLSEKEKVAFEARLAYDSEFSAKFENYQIFENKLKEHYRNQMKSKFKELDIELDKRKTGKVKQLHVWMISAAAVMIVLIVGTFFLSQSNNISEDNSTLARHYWPYESGLPVKMSAKDQYDDAMNAYKQEQWELAEQLLLKIDSDTANYFLGIVAYEQNEFLKSTQYLEKIEVTSSYYSEAQFRLALTAILSGDNKTGKQLLQAQIERNSNFKEQAVIVLKKLK